MNKEYVKTKIELWAILYLVIIAAVMLFVRYGIGERDGVKGIEYLYSLMVIFMVIGYFLGKKEHIVYRHALIAVLIISAIVGIMESLGYSEKLIEIPLYILLGSGLDFLFLYLILKEKGQTIKTWLFVVIEETNNAKDK